MDFTAILRGFADLGPSLGAVIVIGIVCYFLVTLLFKVLDMFVKHGEALKTINENMATNTQVLADVNRNVVSNTKVTEKMTEILEEDIRRRYKGRRT